MQQIIVAVAIAVTAVVTASQASPLPDYPMVFARGTAKIEVKPNLCDISFRIVIRNESSTNALELIKQRSAETLTILADNEIKVEDIVGFEIDKDLIRNHKQSRDQEQRDELAFLGYEMRRTISFTLRDLTKYESIISRLLKATDVVDVHSVFRRTDQKEIESRLLAEAVADARGKAELIAKGSGQRLVKLKAISEHGFERLNAVFGFNSGRKKAFYYIAGSTGGVVHRSSRQLPTPLFIPSTIEFNNSVYLIYKIEEEK